MFGHDHCGIDASSASGLYRTFPHELDGFEEMGIGFVTRVAVRGQRDVFHAPAFPDMFYYVQRIFKEGSIDHVSRSPIFDTQSGRQYVSV
jgi:hypothetical protein